MNVYAPCLCCKWWKTSSVPGSVFSVNGNFNCRHLGSQLWKHFPAMVHVTVVSTCNSCWLMICEKCWCACVCCKWWHRASSVPGNVLSVQGNFECRHCRVTTVTVLQVTFHINMVVCMPLMYIVSGYNNKT